MKLQRHNVYRDSVTMRAMLHAKYNPGMSVPAPLLLGDSPEPLTDYLDVSKKIEDVFQLLDGGKQTSHWSDNIEHTLENK